MKVSDYIAGVIGAHHPFVVQGGAAIHMIDSLARGGHKFTCSAHEQAAGMAADGYAKVKGFGVAGTTCGPGATNLLTAAASAWFERVPVLYLVGQQHDFQEIDVMRVFARFVKYGVLVENPKGIPASLEKAIEACQDGEPGPVILNIFDEVYRAEIEAPAPTLKIGGACAVEAHLTASATKDIYSKPRPEFTDAELAPGKYVNPYRLVRELEGRGQIVTDIGNHGVWVKRACRERVITDNNFGCMGYGIAAAIGVASAGHTTICITGDGGIQMNIQEFATIAKHDLDIKILVLNNQSYGMIRDTQKAWLEGRHHGCELTDLPLVDFERVAVAYGIPSRRWQTDDDIDMADLFDRKGPILVNVTVDKEQK